MSAAMSIEQRRYCIRSSGAWVRISLSFWRRGLKGLSKDSAEEHEKRGKQYVSHCVFKARKFDHVLCRELQGIHAACTLAELIRNLSEPSHTHPPHGKTGNWVKRLFSRFPPAPLKPLPPHSLNHRLLDLQDRDLVSKACYSLARMTHWAPDLVLPLIQERFQVAVPRLSPGGAAWHCVDRPLISRIPLCLVEGPRLLGNGRARRCLFSGSPGVRMVHRHRAIRLLQLKLQQNQG